MESNNFCLTIYVIISVATFSFSQLPISNSLKAPYPNELWFLGSVNGKSYFTETETKRTWFEAKPYCNASNMQLATIRTTSEFDLLREKFHVTHFNGTFWLGGRDSLNIDQFMWETPSGNVTQIDKSIIPELESVVGIRTALVYEKTDSSDRIGSRLAGEFTLNTLCEAQ